MKQIITASAWETTVVIHAKRGNRNVHPVIASDQQDADSSSMPEFQLHSSGDTKSKRRIKDLHLPCLQPNCEDVAVKLPVISPTVASSTSHGRCSYGHPNRNETDTVLDSQQFKLERKMYLPRINSKKGNIFMKSK